MADGNSPGNFHAQFETIISGILNTHLFDEQRIGRMWLVTEQTEFAGCNRHEDFIRNRYVGIIQIGLIYEGDSGATAQVRLMALMTMYGATFEIWP